MGTNDSLDRAQARRFAWLHAAPTERPHVDDADRDFAAVDEGLDATSDALPENDTAARDDAPEACARLADAIERTWKLTEHSLRARATVQLLRLAADVGAGLQGMRAHPRESVRLVRLVASLGDALDGAVCDELAACLPWISPEHPEVIDLAVEAVHADRDVLTRLVYAWLTGPGAWRSPRTVERWNELLPALAMRDDLRGSQRYAAVLLLDLAPSTAAAPTLRALLRAPHLGMRSLALASLRSLGDGHITADDVAFMLDDLLAHELPELDTEALYQQAVLYTRMLAELIVVHAPPRTEAVLTELMRRRVGTARERGVSDASWALTTLAATLPQRALAVVEMWLSRTHGADRLAAVEAAARMPEDLAEPLLRRAIDDGDPSVALRARELWCARLARPCPADPLGGVDLTLLDGAAPTERMISRLLVLRGRSLDARARMVEALLAEAPSREALALLVFSLAADDVWTHNARPALPGDPADWMRLLLVRFGLAGAAGAISLAARGSLDAPNHWFHGLARAVVGDEHLVPRGALDPMRDLAVRAFTTSRSRLVQRDAVRLLRVLGVPRAVVSRCAASLEAPDRTPLPWADELLVHAPPDADLDARAASSFLAAVDEHRWRHAGLWARVAVRRGVAPVRAWLLARFTTAGAMADLCDEAVHELVSAARTLYTTGALDDAWILAALTPAHGLRDDPARARDAVRRLQLACGVVRGHGSDPLRAALRRQCSHERFCVETAARAAAVLFALPDEPWDASLVDALLVEAPLSLRVPLLACALHRRRAPTLSRAGRLALLGSDEGELTARLARLVEDHPAAFVSWFDDEAMAAVRDPRLAAAVQRMRARNAADEPWWRDGDQRSGGANSRG